MPNGVPEVPTDPKDGNEKINPQTDESNG